MSDPDPLGRSGDPWPAPPSAGSPPPPPPGYGQPSYGGQAQPPYGYQAYTAPQTEGTAVGALVAAILSWVACPIVPAIVALVLVPNARRKIEASQGRLTGEGLLTAAKWVAIINIGFWVLLFGGALLLAVLGMATSTTTTTDFSLGSFHLS